MKSFEGFIDSHVEYAKTYNNFSQLVFMLLIHHTDFTRAEKLIDYVNHTIIKKIVQ